jgi:hypothetical protein
VNSPAPTFDAQDLTIACSVSLLAQFAFVLVLSMPSPKLVEADISNDNAQPIAVAVTPVLKLGAKTPTKLPTTWQRKRPPPPKQAPAPSPLAAKTPDAIPTTAKSAETAPLHPTIDASTTEKPAPEPSASSQAATAASTEGSEQGAANGTETDPLKARAVDMYRAQLAAWFISHFDIRGKIPFAKLKTLAATADVHVTSDRKLGSFSVVKPSGDPTFDSEVQVTLTRIQSGGVELPAPPPMYPDLLDTGFKVRFHCTNERLCE